MASRRPPQPKAEPAHPLAVNPLAAALLGPLVELFTPTVLFALELNVIFSAKPQDLLNRYLDLPMGPPQDSPEAIVLRIKELFEKARNHWNEGRPREAKAGFERLLRYLQDQGVFAPLPPAVPPLRQDDLDSLRMEAKFMRDYVRAVIPE